MRTSLHETPPAAEVPIEKEGRGLLLHGAANAMMWTMWWLSYNIAEDRADNSHDGWCATTHDLCFFSTVTLFVSLGSVLGSSCMYLLKSRRDAHCKKWLASTCEALIPDIAFIFTDYAATLIPIDGNRTFPWQNVLLNFFGLCLVQALTRAMLERQCHSSHVPAAITTGVSAALYTTAEALSKETSWQALSIFASTACAPVMVAGMGRLHDKCKKQGLDISSDQTSKKTETENSDQDNADQPHAEFA